MKKTKRLGLFAIALTALSCVFPGNAKAGGDIRSIEFYPEPEGGEVGVVNNLDRPLIKGEKVKFKIRLANRGWFDTYSNLTDPAYMNPWMLRAVPGSGSVTNRMPQIGLRVGGGLRYAEILSWDIAKDLDHGGWKDNIFHTDVICQYTVQAGDFAMPLKLSDPSGTRAAMDGDPLLDTPDKRNYYMTQSNLWGFYPKLSSNEADRVEFYFGPTVLDNSEFPTWSDYKNLEKRDYDLSSANIQIKAIDFDETYAVEEEEVWRNVAAGTTSSTPAVPRLEIPGGASGPYKYYVWVDDPTVAEISGGTDYTFCSNELHDVAITRKVGTVTVNEGDVYANFVIKALPDQEDKTTLVYMSDTPTNIYNHANTLIQNFTIRKIKVVKAPPPSVNVVMDPANGLVSTSTNNYLSVASLDIELTKAWTQDVQVLVTPVMKSGSGKNPFDYIGVSTAMSGNEAYDGTLQKVTIPAGSTKYSLATGMMLYVYANRANDDTAKGIRFVPTLDPSAANYNDAVAFFEGEFTPATLQINTCTPVVTTTQPDNEYFNIPANTLTDFTIKVADAMWDLHGTEADPAYYSVFIDFNGTGAYEQISNLTANASGEITFQYRYVVGGKTYQSKLYVQNRDGVNNKNNPLLYTVQVNVAKKVKVDADNVKKTYCEGDTAELKFTFTEAFDYISDAYVFLEPANDESREMVICDEFEYGIPISVGETEPNRSAYITFKDGKANASFKYNVVVRSDTDINDDSNVIGVWGSEGITLYATNAAPTVISVTMNETPFYENNKVIPVKAAVGVNNIFEIGVEDASEIDLEDDGLITIVQFWDGGSVGKTVTLTNNPFGQQIQYAFANGGEGVQNKITVASYDKDMTPAEITAAKKNPFTVLVETLSEPAISLSPYNSSTEFMERQDYGSEKGRIYIDLTVPPSGLNVASNITVQLTVEPVDPSNTVLPTLNTYEIKFKNGETRKQFHLESLDGTRSGGSKGYRIKARVIDTATSPDKSKSWAQYYLPCEDFVIYVVNENPTIGPSGLDLSPSNAIPAAINVPQKITWFVDDVDADLRDLRVSWTYNNGVSNLVQDLSSGRDTMEIVFTSGGDKQVHLVVEDKDGGRDIRTYYYKVAPNKLVELHPRRSGAGISKFSNKYVSSVGIGDGRVWADGATAPTEINNFVQKWSYAPEDTTVKVYARGYKYNDGVGDIDDGSLAADGGKDFPLNSSGSAWTGGSYYQYKNALGKDSFFYGWFLSMSGGDSGYEGSHLNGVVQPETMLSRFGSQSVPLPEYDESAVTYDTTLLEAVFSLEYRTTDNLGDINQDGIPDVYAVNPVWRGSDLVTATGKSIDDEDPGDLIDLSLWNEDVVSTTTGAATGDYLPSLSSSGSGLIPHIYNWTTVGNPFTAIDEIRGFHPGLNYRSSNDGRNINVRGDWISDPDFSKAEWISLAHHNPECGVDLANSEDWEADVATVSNWVLTASNAWIPENRTDPTTDDTDGDGFPDGYEYYYWYNAAVGEIDKDGKWIRLTGRRFSLEDIATGEVLSSDEIAAAFNPTVASSAAASLTRDTDNDGLTDLEEFAMGTNPIDWDSDDDGLSDYWEVMNGMNPLSSVEGQNGAMNADGDYMARFDTDAVYSIVKFTLPDNSVREYAFTGNYAKYFNDEDGALSFNEETIENNQIVAISVFHYGSATNNVYVPRFRGGKVENTVDYFGAAAEAKPLDALVWELDDMAEATIEIVKDQKVTLIHDQVRAQFDFDPRTGWFMNKDGFVAARWKDASSGKKQAGDSGKAVNTAPFTALDEYLLLKYRYETNKESPVKLAHDKGPFDINGDMALWNVAKGVQYRRCGEVFLRGTTCPNVAFQTPDWVTETPNLAGIGFLNEAHGADSDADGVPDGWELYVGRNPNVLNTADEDEDSDDMSLALEYAGTDSCNAYAECPTIFANHPGLSKGWYNKFFPTNPDDKDTDGDGIADGKEGASWTMRFVFGNHELGENGVDRDYTFIYGEKAFEDRDDGSICIRGGGLNPCSVDTDGDCLPDPWERQFAGLVFSTQCVPLNDNIPEAYVTIMRRNDGFSDQFTAVDQYISGGMDGTYADDACTPWYNGRKDPNTGTARNFDFDNDGLQNYQEYLVQTLRHLRYDDSSTPLMGQWMPSGTPESLRYFGFIPMNIMDGDTFYAKVKKAGYPATGAWNFRDLGYFAPPPHAWDPVALNKATAKKVNYDEMGYRILLPPKAIADGTAASGYCSTDPRNWDSDGDGMDDYYELFHGLNPLLGEIAGGFINNDLIALAYDGKIANWCNAWTGWPMMPPADPVYDAMRFPWMMGTPGADADGDGLSNYEEALFANMSSPSPTHTDPTPLWMTDSSSLNKASFTSQYYNMDCDVLVPDLVAYPWFNLGFNIDPDGFIFAFEENEGYDTDHDGINDMEEKKMTITALSDPINFADPDRRQAIWFSGDKSAAVSYACTPGNGSDVGFDTFRQFTVEAWINPEDVSRDQVILERAVNYYANTLSNNVSKIRANFRLGIMADGRVYGLFDSSDAVQSGTPDSCSKVTGPTLTAGNWTHVAMSYDGRNLILFLNGQNIGTLPTTMIPANGIVGVTQEPFPRTDNNSGDGTFPANSSYTYYTKSAMVLGATALDDKAVVLGSASEWTSFGAFYKGFIDEVRVWDGVRTETEILEDYKTRFTVADVELLRQEVFEAYQNGATRNDNDSYAMLPAELVYHYNFSTLPAAADKNDVMWEPTGFTAKVLDNVRIGGEEIPGDLYCGWWKSIPVKSKVYMNYRWVPWIPNTVSHLPALDGSVADSKYWGRYIAGVTLAEEAAKAEEYVFPNSMNPYSFYHNIGGADTDYFNNTLMVLMGGSNGFSSDVGEVMERHIFESSRASLGTTDLLPLGGAFAKTVSAMWDGLGASDAAAYTGDDLDGNGLPDWWEDIYAAQGPFDCNTLMNYNGMIVEAREAYIRDLAAGMQPDGTINAAFKATSDRDNDGMPDWWEDLYCISDENGEDDNDGDGLSNYAEYLIAECFSNYGFPRVNPIQARTFAADGQLVTDYFLKQGQLYLGEMFSDHDFCEDSWEDLYADRVGSDTETLFASRYVNDMWADNDEDGWSNFAECRAGTDPTRARALSFLSDDIPEYPVPTIRATVRYNGNQSTKNASLVIKSYTASSVKGKPDASWTMELGSKSAQAGGSASGKEGGASTVGKAFERQLGANPGGKMKINLGSGMIVPGTISISFRDLNAYRVSEEGGGLWLSAGSTVWCEGIREYFSGTETTKTELIAGSGVHSVVGEINYETGDVTIDFSKLDAYLFRGETSDAGGGGAYVYHWSNSEDAEFGKIAYQRLKIEKSFVKIEWRGQIASAENMWKINLAKSDEGVLREGTNTFEAFLDLNEDGMWTAGEPYGVATGVDVGWSTAEFAVELTDVAPQMFRVDMLSAMQSNDFESQKAFNDRGVQNSIGIGSNFRILETAVGQRMPAATETETRVRMIRMAVNGFSGIMERDGARYADGVVLDVTRNFSAQLNNGILTERDLLDAGYLDLDWNGIPDAAGIVEEGFSSVTTLTYRVVLGDGTIDVAEATNNNCFATAFVNVFERGELGNQSQCVPVSPSGTIYSAQPTFKWTHANTIGKDYPAFQLRVWKGSALVYDSGVRRAPPRDVNGVYSWSAPIYADMTTPNSVVFSNTDNYTWSVSMLDAKFTTPNTTETKREFRVEATGLLGSIADYGILKAKVHYFGPVVPSASANTLKNMVRVQAFTTPDFTGMPAGEARVTDVAGLSSAGGTVVTMRGLPVGEYYVRAFIDTNPDCELSKWESWGYACRVGDGAAKAYRFTPKAFTVVKNAEAPEAEVYIEDMDIDNDGIPDAWEWDESTDSLNLRSSPTGSTFFTKVNPNLAKTVAAYVNLANGTGATLMGAGNVYASMTLMNALLSTDTASVAAIANLLSAPGEESAVSEKLAVKIDSFSLNEGVGVSVTTEVTGAGNELVIVGSEAKVTVVVVASAAVNFADATEIKVKSVDVKANDTTNVKISAEELKYAIDAAGVDSAAFFKVKLIQE